MDRKELYDALEELESRLDVAVDIRDEDYTDLRDALDKFKTLMHRRIL